MSMGRAILGTGPGALPSDAHTLGIDPMLLERALSGGDTSSHVGILAVDTRLRSTFGQEYGLTIETGKNAGTKVTIRLPKYVGQKAAT